MEEVKNEINTVFEVSFEAGHKVGGIFTVLKSKSKEMKQLYGDNYVTIGFYNSKSALENFEEADAPAEVKRVFDELKHEGIIAYYGRWITANNVKLILLDTKEFREKGVWFKDEGMVIDRNVNLIKRRLWDDYGIDSVNTGGDYEEPLAWAWAAGMLIEKLCTHGACGKSIAHFHEWLAGAGLLYLKKNSKKLGLVFTTHATRLGRALSSEGVNLIDKISESFHFGVKDAERLGVKAQHLIEVSCAKEAHMFTTVSDVVGEEAECILGVKPGMITPNALEFSEYPTMEKVIAERRAIRRKMKKFLSAYFSSYYPVKTYDCVIFFTLGRYEFYNKGINLYIEALGKLNKKLKEEGEHNPVYAFIWIPTHHSGVKEEVEENMLAFDRINELINEEAEMIKENLLLNSLEDTPLNINLVCGEEFTNELKVASRTFLEMRKGKQPPLCAFKINEGDDAIIKSLRKNGLNNNREDAVKVIFYPEYLSPKDPILSMSTNDAIMGCTMGIFPSRYEPWGLTIMEAGALLASGITTNSSGAGAFINNVSSGKEGLKVIDIKKKGDEAIIEEISELMKEVVLMDKDSLLELSINARNLAEKSDWKIQISNYVKAYNNAFNASNS